MADQRQRKLVVVLALLLVCWSPRRSEAQDAVADQLQRELNAMKKQMQQMQQKMEAQQRLLDKLTAERKSAVAHAPSSTAPVAQIAKSPGGAPTAATEKPPAATQPAPMLATAPPAQVATPESEDEIERRVTESVMRKMQPSLAAANKTFPSQFNPAISVAVDMVGSYKDKERGNFEFRSAELGLSANVDPFVRAYAFINGGNNGVEVEEASMVTTSLPWNLTVQGGRFFSDFGRLSKWHDHDLPFVNRPTVLDEYVGGESQSDGLQLSWLAPTDQYLNLTGGMYNKIGADNERVDNDVPRNLSEFTYLGRAATYFNIADEHGLDVGATFAWTPNVAVDHGAMRYLTGADVTYRYTPLASASYQGVIWGTEVLYNRETRPITSAGEPAVTPTSLFQAALQTGDEPPADTTTTFRRVGATGLYSYVEARLSRRYYPGFLFQWVQDLNRQEPDTLSYSPYFTIWLSEFDRLRAQYTYLDSPGNHESQFFLQWTVFIGSHAHGFRDR